MKLTIVERFLILIHKTDKTGFSVLGTQFNKGLIAAMFLDLVQNEDVSLRDKMLICSSQAASNSIHPILFQELAKSKRPRKLNAWFNRLDMKMPKIKKALFAQLAGERIIKIEKKKFLGLIPYSLTHLINKPLQAEMIRELKKYILMGGDISEENKIVLGIITALNATNFLGVDRDEKREIRKKVKTLDLSNVINHEMKEALEQLNAAVFVAVISPTISH